MSQFPAFLKRDAVTSSTGRQAVSNVDVWAESERKTEVTDVLEDLDSVSLFDEDEATHVAFPDQAVTTVQPNDDHVDMARGWHPPTSDSQVDYPDAQDDDDQADRGVSDDPYQPEHDAEESDTVPPVYVGGARLVNWSNSARGGMTIEVALRDVGPREVNPFKGLKFGKENGQRFKTWVGPYSELIEITSLPELESVYAGETLLMYYGDTCTKGVTVKVLLDGGPDGVNGKHPFDGMDIGNVEGMDLYVSFWAINDDETLIHKKSAVKRTPFHQLSEVRQANTVVRDEEFVNFLSARLGRLLGSVRPTIKLEDGPSKWAAEVIRLYLGVGSKSVMNEDNLEGLEARKRWHVMISEYYQSDEFNQRRQFFRR